MITDAWVFVGVNAQFPAAVFTTRAIAETWISRTRVSGTLTAYPLDISAYDWAVQNGYFSAEKEMSPTKLAKFASGAQEHYHYEDGKSVYGEAG